MSLTALTANASDFALQNNQIVISAPGFSESPAIGSNGVIARVTDIPKTAGLGIPSLSFALLANGTLTNGTYSFRIGVALDDDNSARRFEASISKIEIVVTNNGASVVSRIPTNTPLTVLGTEGSYILSMTETNPSTGGPISVNGGTVTFNADTLISQIKGSNPAFEPILNSFGGSAHYTYRIVAQQTSYTPDTAQFGTVTSASTFTPLPRIGTTCTSKSNQVFLLSSVLAESFTAAYALQGQFSIIGATGGPAGAPAPFSTTCTTGNVDVVQTSVAAQTTKLLSDLASISFPASGTLNPAQLAAINATISQAHTLSELSIAQITANTLTTAAGISALESLGLNLEVVGKAKQRGANINQEIVTESFKNLSALITTLSTKKLLSSTEKQQITVIALAALDDSTDLITSSSSNLDIESTINAAAQLVAATLAAGTTLSTEFLNLAGALTHTALLQGLPSLASSLGITINTATTTQLRSGIQNNPALLERSLRYSIPLNSKLNENSLLTTLTSKGVSTADAKRVVGSMTTTFSNIAGIAIDAKPSQSAQNTISLALGSDAISFDTSTGLLAVSSASVTEYFVATSVRLVPDSLPQGRLSLPDGRIVAINQGLAVELAPAPRNVLEFASAVEGAGYDINFTPSGSIDITLSTTERFSGAFAYQKSSTAADQCATLGITYPEGDPANSSYAFKISCANGPTQQVLPFISNGIFYAVGQQAGLNISTDRNTGILSIPGIGQFKPSFFIQSPSATDLLFLQKNELSGGLAFRAVDLNGDGVLDFEMIDSTGKQSLYGTLGN